MELWLDSISQLLYGSIVIALLFWVSQRSHHGFLRCFSWLCWLETAWLLTATLQREEWRLLWVALAALAKGLLLLYAVKRWPSQNIDKPSMGGASVVLVFVLLASASLFIGRVLGPFYRVNGDALGVSALLCATALFSVVIQGVQRLQLLSMAALQGGLILLAVQVNPMLPLYWIGGYLLVLLALFARLSRGEEDSAPVEA